MAATTKRYAVVTGGNKGIGFEICRQLASNGVLVVLTARDENRGLQAVQKLRDGDPALSDNLVFHKLDVADSSSISSLADFIRTQFGKLDILVNNAGIFGATMDVDVMRAVGPDRWLESITDTYELAEECLKTNYHGAKQMIETFLPLLQQSDLPRIVNNVKHEWATSVLSDVENLTEEKVEQVLNQYLKDFKEGSLATKGWPRGASAYTLSKAALNGYSRIIAKKYPNLCINCVCPGYVKTDINQNTGFRTPDEGAEGPVKLALLPYGGPSGRFFDQTEEGSF
ncbi:unnamed protein product [Linum tenue]|uniref:Short-chain dehydrogenase/reductase n=1 Tax=Linum tenue TaxID=586396 RepID=A0AAV0H3G3_9ROSI|nr:unnamed protein product [Linum tenue]